MGQFGRGSAVTAGRAGAPVRRGAVAGQIEMGSEEDVMRRSIARLEGLMLNVRISAALIGALCASAALAASVMPTARAQAPAASPAMAAQRARLLAEQTRPQREVPFNPADFDRYVGFYELSPTAFFHVFRRDDHYFAQLTGQPAVEWYPQSRTEFFATVVAAQISFLLGPHGAVTALVLHQNGFQQMARRVSPQAAARAAATLRERIRQQRPSPGSAAAVRAQVDSFERTGRAQYAQMRSQLATAAREQAANSAALFKAMGPLRSLRFYKVLPSGVDDYLATFAHGKLEILIAPLGPDGKISTLFLHPVP